MVDYVRESTAFTSVTTEVDFRTLQDAIWVDATFVALFQGLSVRGTTYTFMFNQALTAPEETALDAIIAAHTGKVPEPSALDQAKQTAKQVIDDAAGEARGRYITVAPGQDAVYVEKGKDAQAYKDAGYPVDETGYEFVTAEKNATGKTATQAADDLLAVGASWKGLAASIEELRINYKGQVDAAVDENTAIALGSKGAALLDAV
jgi:hypothetical protein